MRLDIPTGVIHGTLLSPAGRNSYPVALVIAGSGPTDRNGDSPLLLGKNGSLRLLAEGLAGHGIATLRYDKRGIGESAAAGPREADLRFETYAADAAAWVRQLRADPRFSSVVVIGHSEGSLVGLRALRDAPADAFVSIAGVGRSAADVLRDQLRPQLPPDLWNASESILAALEGGRTVDDVPQALMALYRPSVQPYLISWFALDPAAEIARLAIPTLIVQGTTDIQVSVEEARTLERASRNAEVLIVEGMNHVLKAVPADPAAQRASYSDPDLPVVTELITGIADFVRRAAPR